MKLQRSTIILMFGALLMGGAFYYYENLIIPAQEAKEAFSRKLFKFTEAEIQSLLVKTETKTLRFERDTEISAPTDLWLMEILELAEEPVAETTTTEETVETPAETTTTEETVETPAETTTTEETETETPAETTTTEETTNTEANQTNPEPVPENPNEKIYANQAYVSFLIEQLVSQRSEQSLTVAPEQLEEYGLNSPVATIEITLKDGTTHQMTLGTSEFSGNYIYAQVDPPSSETADRQVMVVAKNFEYAVDRTLEDWKQPAEIEAENSEPPAGEPPENNSETPAETPVENTEDRTTENEDSEPSDPSENNDDSVNKDSEPSDASENNDDSASSDDPDPADEIADPETVE